MNNPLKYVVVCGCGTGPKAVAFIDDRRPMGGSLSVSGIGEQDTAALFAVGDGKHYGKAATMWSEWSVTETTWEDGHSTWIIRCACDEQVQLSGENLQAIGDALAAARDELPTVGVGACARHELPLGVLTRILAR